MPAEPIAAFVLATRNPHKLAEVSRLLAKHRTTEKHDPLGLALLIDEFAATVRNCETGLLPLRLVNRSIGHPRLAATAASLPAGLVGRGLPTRYISATSSSPSA